MAELSPLPLSRLVARAFEELERNGCIFDLPSRLFYTGDPLIDTSVMIHGRRASSPLGPAAGPHTQMAQNIVLAWLGGARVFELKTVQDNDRIEVARPCIEAGGITLNVEWSQELRIEQSLEEYVKASMLIEMLVASGAIRLAPGFDRWLFDVSVGYDLDGIRSERMSGFLEAMQRAAPVIDRLRHAIPYRWRHLREIDFNPRIAPSVTLSTFHGCRPQEIEGIVEYLMTEMEFDCAIKLNPTLLGRETVRALLHDRLGLTDVRVPAESFDTDLAWHDATRLVDRLRTRAAASGRGFAVKLTNTLVVENCSRSLPPSQRVAYLSGAPLHVLAMHLVERFRRAFGDSIPISFSAGIDRTNYPDAVRLGLAPVTVCSDLLKQGGYGRLQAYSTGLASRMRAAGASTIDEFIRAGSSAKAPGDVKDASTARYIIGLEFDPRYRFERIAERPRKTGRKLDTFDCSLCDLCIPACPNDATMRIPSVDRIIPHDVLRRSGSEWKRVRTANVMLKENAQIATLADLCNDCGNCTTFCPDGGSPNEQKPRIYATEEGWQRAAPLDGFHVAPDRVLGRFDGGEYELQISGATTILSGPSFRVMATDGSFEGDGPPAIDLGVFAVMDFLRRALFDTRRVHFINCEAEIPCP